MAALLFVPALPYNPKTKDMATTALLIVLPWTPTYASCGSNYPLNHAALNRCLHSLWQHKKTATRDRSGLPLFCY